MRYLLLILIIFITFSSARTVEEQKIINQKHIEKYNLKEQALKDETTITNILTDVENIEILDVIIDKNNDIWYKTKYGYIYGDYFYIDVRQTAATFLHIREKPSVQSDIISFHYKGANVIVIGNAGKNWVLTTDGYIASKYLKNQTNTKNRNEKYLNAKIIPFRLSPSLQSKIIKYMNRSDMYLSVPSPEIIQKGYTLKESKQKYLQEKKKVAKEVKKKVKFQNLLASISIDSDGYGISLKSNFNNIYFQDDTQATIELETMIYEQITKTNLLFGFDKPLTKDIYIGISGGISSLKWTKDPLGSSDSSETSANSWIAKINLGTKYKLNKNTNLDFNINHSLYDYTTTLSKNAVETVIKDSSTTKLNIGIYIKF